MVFHCNKLFVSATRDSTSSQLRVPHEAVHKVWAPLTVAFACELPVTMYIRQCNYQSQAVFTTVILMEVRMFQV